MSDAGDRHALDIMYYVATPEFIAKWTDAKEGELICRMERAIGSLPQFESIPAMLAKMDDAGVDKVYLDYGASNFIGSRMGQDRAVWGTSGLPWKESLDQVDALGLKAEARRKLIHDNARELFRL